MTKKLLEIKNLSTCFHNFTAVKNANLTLNSGETTALVGESGSGKTVLALSILKLLPQQICNHPNGEIIFKNLDLIKASNKDIRNIRGNKIAMIFQEPMTALNPLHTIERQITENILLHSNIKRKDARIKCIELLEKTGLTNFKKRLNAYPHELSGGQRQRVMIAMALANNPEILIADEPTTALDVSIQMQILELLTKLQKEHNLTILFITHNLEIVRKIADKVAVMKQGEIVETNDVDTIFKNPTNEYTKKLINSSPKGNAVPLKSSAKEILKTKNLSVLYPLTKNFFGKVIESTSAVKNANISLKKGETLGVVGESGSGKTSLASAILRLIKSDGEIIFKGNKLNLLQGRETKSIRKYLQVVFQDPFSSLNPRMTVQQIIEEGLRAHNLTKDPLENERIICKTLEEVSIDPALRSRFPHEFSGGQRQRIAIARSLVLEPECIVLDEPTSALDASVQVQIIELLKNLQKNRGLTYIFISHDMRLIKSISHQILIMKNGEIVEQGKTLEVLKKPKSEYTKNLISASML